MSFEFEINHDCLRYPLKFNFVNVAVQNPMYKNHRTGTNTAPVPQPRTYSGQTSQARMASASMMKEEIKVALFSIVNCAINQELPPSEPSMHET